MSMPALSRCLACAAFFVGAGTSAQPTGLRPDDPAARLATDDYFGWDVAVSPDYAVVGAYRVTEGGVRSGVVEVYAWTAADWVPDGTLVPDDASADDQFGASVSLSGDRALVGAIGRGEAGAVSGAAYVFVRTATGWVQEAKLTAADAEAGDYFGYAVSLSGDRALVGALAEDDEGTDSGAAYVFTRSGATWTQEAKLTALDADVDDFFGFSVSLSDDRALVGAYRDDDGGDRTGSAYVFVRSGAAWTQEAKLTASDAQPVDLFGRAVSLSGDRALVGSHFGDNPARKSGSAYVFARSGTTWAEEAKLVPDDAGIDQQFGISVALSGDRALVGSRRESLGRATGAAYVFARSGAAWAQEADLFAPRLDSLHALGQSVALSGDRALVGAPGANDDGDRSGAVYSFARRGAHWAVDARLIRPGVTAYVSTVIDGERGVRYLGAPSAGVTVDDLAAQNLVRGVPGYYPGARAPNLWTAFDAATNTWLPSAGAGEELTLGRAFRWQMYDRVQGNPNVSVGVAFPFVLTTVRPANTADVTVELDTAGTRFNTLANPFGTDLALTGLTSWPGGANVSSNAPVWVWDPETRSWDDAPSSVGPWHAFRVKAKGPRTNGAARRLTIPASASVPGLARPAAPSAGLAFALDGFGEDGFPVADRAFTIRFSNAAGRGSGEGIEKLQPPSATYALVGARVDGQVLSYDVRPFAAAEIPLAVEARGVQSEMTLSWDASTLPAGLPVVLVDVVTGAEVDVRAQSAVAFRVAPRPPLAGLPARETVDGAEAVDRFVLRIGSRLASPEGAEVVLLPVSPNPSVGSARVAFTVPEAGRVRLTVIDVRGREVAVLVDGARAAGRHEARLDSGSLAAGVYAVRLEAAGQVRARRAVIVR